MKDVKKDLRTGYYNALNNISVNSTSIPLFDKVPRGQEEPYIYFERLVSNEQSTKDSEDSEVRVTLTIVTRDMADSGGRAFSEQIADNVIDKVTISNSNLLTLSSDRYISVTRLSNTDSFFEDTDNGTRYFYQIEFEHKVEVD